MKLRRAGVTYMQILSHDMSGFLLVLNNKRSEALKVQIFLQFSGYKTSCLYFMWQINILQLWRVWKTLQIQLKNKLYWYHMTLGQRLEGVVYFPYLEVIILWPIVLWPTNPSRHLDLKTKFGEADRFIHITRMWCNCWMPREARVSTFYPVSVGLLSLKLDSC